MGDTIRELILLSRARQALAEARSVDQVKDIHHEGQFAKGYAKKNRLDHDIIILDASPAKMEAEQLLGQLLSNLPRPNSSPGSRYSGPIRLRDLAITESDSSRAQRTERLPQAAFRGQVSRKPKIVRQIIEKVSPGPYLEMFSRTAPTNSAWTAYGNQIPTGRQR